MCCYLPVFQCLFESFRRDLNEAEAVYICEYYLACRFVIKTLQLRLKFRLTSLTINAGPLWNLRISPLDGSCVGTRVNNSTLRVRFFKKIQDWILKFERIRKRILRFFTKQINPRSLGSWCVEGTEESTPRVDFSVPLTPIGSNLRFS